MDTFKSRESADEMDQTPTTSNHDSADTTTNPVPKRVKYAYSASPNKLKSSTIPPSTQTSGRVLTPVEQLRDRASQQQDEYTDLCGRIAKFRVEPGSDENPARTSAAHARTAGKQMLRGLRKILDRTDVGNRHALMSRSEAVIREEIEDIKAVDRLIIRLYNDLIGRRRRLLDNLEVHLDMWQTQPSIGAARYLEVVLINLKEFHGDLDAINAIADQGREMLEAVSIVQPPLILQIFDEIADINPENGRRLYSEYAQEDDNVEKERQWYSTLLAEAKAGEREAREEEQKARDRLALAVKRRT